MKDPEKLQAALDEIAAKGLKPGTLFNEGKPGGAFKYLLPAVFEKTLKAAGLFISEDTHIQWVLPFTEEFRVPGQGPPVLAGWTDFLCTLKTPRMNEIYRHYKGGRYKVVGIAFAMYHTPFMVHSVVVYEGLNDEGQRTGPAWIRHVDDFCDRVVIPRFAKEE